MTFVLISGGIDLSVGSVVALSSVVSASIAQKNEVLNKFLPCISNNEILLAILAISCGLIVGLLVGLLNGIAIACVNISPFIATLSTMVIVRGIAFSYTNAYPVSNFILYFIKKNDIWKKHICNRWECKSCKVLWVES